MSPFQVVALVVLGCLTALSLVAIYKGWSGRREGAAWVVVWTLAGVAVAWPDLTRRVAQKLGIGRGADFVMYCAVMAMLIGFFMVYSRLRRLRRDITVLARHVAIREAGGHGSPAEKPIEGE